jgi:protease PrsW
MILLGILLALLPGLAWLFFYLQEDPNPEPKSLLAAVFVCGGAFAFGALTIQIIVQETGFVLDPVSSPFGHPAWIIASLFVLSFIEEIFKFGAAFFMVHKKPDFDEPVDAMIYMVVAAIGFATVENIGSVTPRPGETQLLATIYETLSLRFVGATLLHTLTSGIVGYYWAITIRDFGQKRFVWYGIMLATGLHTLFNYLIITYGNLIYTLVFVLAVGLIVLHDFEKLKARAI